MVAPFNVWQMFFIARHRLYRVYFEDGKLYFIRIGGQLAHADSGLKIIPGITVGLAVAGFAEWLASKERIMSPARMAELDRTSPSRVIGQHKHDMVLSVNDIIEANLEPWSFFKGLGSYLAQCQVRLTNHKKLAFQITDVNDLSVALRVLPELFGDRLRTRVKWDPELKKCVRA